MEEFLGENFLLESETAKKLYHECAENMPIIDYHCHLSPKDIAEDRRYSNITEAWLYSDHYKWRAMRFCGCDERYITGNSSDFEKFREYCRIMPMLIGNPLYHWSHLELRKYFDCNLILCPENALDIWSVTSERLICGEMSAKQIISSSGVKLLCTTDDPCDPLEYHKKLASQNNSFAVLPTFRPDKLLNINRKGISEYISKFGKINGCIISDISSLEIAVSVALDHFEELGCRTADHGFDNCVCFVMPDPYHADLIFKKAIESDGKNVTEDELALFRAYIMRFLGSEYRKRNMVMQIHCGVLRDPNSAMFAMLGADSGFDTVYGKSCTAELAKLFNYMNCRSALPKTVIYSADPAENLAVAALCGSFCKGDGGGYPTVTQGSAWWFNDNIDGMRSQMKSYANLAAFGKFLGMLTDSRSVLSYPRHDYFRRILCSVIGEFVEKGLYPPDYSSLSSIVKDICYFNIKNYFGFEV